VRPVIEALNTDPAGPAEVVLVDNSAGREGRDLAQSLGVKLVSRSGGFSDGCNDGIAASTQPVVALLGHDTVPRPGWLPPLIQGLELPDVGAVIPTIEDGGRPGTFNTSGGYLTYVGLAWVSEHGRPIPENDEVSVVDFPCGGAMALRRETWDRFGGFRGQYFLYQEDSDLGWRLRLAGLSTVRIPDSRVVHEYEFGRQPNKMFLLERNHFETGGSAKSSRRGVTCGRCGLSSGSGGRGSRPTGSSAMVRCFAGCGTESRICPRSRAPPAR